MRGRACACWDRARRQSSMLEDVRVGSTAEILHLVDRVSFAPASRPCDQLFQWFPQCNKRHPPNFVLRRGARPGPRDRQDRGLSDLAAPAQKVEMLFGAGSLTAKEPRQRLSGVLRVPATTRRSNLAWYVWAGAWPVGRCHDNPTTHRGGDPHQIRRSRGPQTR